MTVPAVPALPGEVHPAYADNAIVTDWVNGLRHSDEYTLRMAVHEKLLFGLDPPDVTRVIARRVMRLDRYRCRGRAPYVGQPFVYCWWVAVDSLGRMAAGEAWRQMLDPVDRA